MKYLLDTNAISETLKSRPNEGFLDWLDTVVSLPEELDDTLYVSVLSLAEMRRGALKLPSSPRREEIERRIAGMVEDYNDRLLTVNLAVGEQWAILAEHYKRSGITVGLIDELIAATALANDLTLVTRNIRHFEHSGCKLLSPWSE
ncbi:MAG: type II toxin-antitoxin system VapC family toxin [Candidatus Brevundimonas colombiensis]|uniref:Ribonuclease VapC n=1 Tax=Candidatus Brevundimonas colombiensis TaxID=3121376 RepID=A0AAJ5X583_9CAUL|nr:type II toxin-antitoxin system VapC family toxin [Brevundimonas sp.]WEK41252.1 MAG: type II toxin-antitoxin system VapC family toxin [Brevundimonas sp.]